MMIMLGSVLHPTFSRKPEGTLELKFFASQEHASTDNSLTLAKCTGIEKFGILYTKHLEIPFL
jgi:hypothetical protein